MREELKKRPIEIFGYDCEYEKEHLKISLKQQYCKYIQGECVKPRKSEPEIKVGICTVGATVNNGKIVKPVIICPQRFRSEEMFETIREKYLSSWKNIKWVKEVNIGVGGNVDFVAVQVNGKDEIQDFLCVEIQAGGTTGTPYPYLEDFKKHGHFTEKNYTFGINWANEFSKTMMQQAYKKGKIVEHWNRKIVFVVQDVALEYLHKATDCSLLLPNDKNLPVDFCTFSLEFESDKWKLSFDKIYSTSIEGINKMLGGAPVDEYPSEDDFIQNIKRKGISDGVFVKP